ncbi:unnamed protein product [Rotaria sordida]|uniref:Condensation domain-containing protein n=1 Tax=Rotaria sordida TaxID=392033 RepID=A0A815CZA1_9BILA|nr:unnamed protein product [Rotaria sordida]
MTKETNNEWKRLNIWKSKCSYSQERIWIDEQIRESLIKNSEDLYNYNSVIVYQIEDGILPIKRFRRSIKILLDKHEIFQTTLDYNADEHSLQQTINQNSNDLYSYELTYVDVNDIEKVNNIIYNEQISKHFDLNKGKMFRCHLLKGNAQDKNHLVKNDYILLIYHHSGIDQYSKYLFIKELTNGYLNGKLNNDDKYDLKYIDYSQYEHEIDLTNCEEFWQDLFSDYNFNHRLKIPYDNKLDNISTGSYYSFDIDKSLTRQIFRYKNKININLFRIFLTTFYVYLFKLTQDTDISITGFTPNRIRNELNHIIGPFENLIIYRHELDPHQSFNGLIKKIDKLCSNIKENAFYPYQQLIAYARKFSSLQYPFNQVSLRLYIEDDQWNLDPNNNLILKQIYLINHQLFPRYNKLTPIDLTLNIIGNLEKQTLSFYFDYSNKLFEQETIQTLALRYQKLLKHLFDVSSNFDLDDEPIYKLSIILSDEERLMHNINLNKD